MSELTIPSFLTSGKTHSKDDIEKILNDRVNDACWINTNKKVSYCNVPCAFDIETTSFYDQWGDKAGLMYEWTIGINGAVIIGRTWDDLMDCFDRISKHMGLCSEKRMIFYVHNLAFEMQWISYRFNWEKVFAVDNRKPLYALTDTGIEFRCSYILSGYSLKKLGDELQVYKVQKMVGDLDYDLIRHSGTVMTDKELKYCENDVRVVMAYIQEEIERNGSITRIPLTNTGYVRKYCRDEVLYEHGNHKTNTDKFWTYRRLMKALTLDEATLLQCVRAFQGGFTHASAFYSGDLLEDVHSIDFTSAYPAVMVTEKYPMGSCDHIKISSPEHFYDNIRLYCCMFDVRITGLEATFFYDNYLSSSRCHRMTGEVLNNGRVVSADSLITTMTDVDFQIIKRTYKWQKFEVTNFRRWRRGYLPTDLVKSILHLYRNKTELKGVEGMETEYLRSKGMLNSVYGMCVTSVLMPERNFTQETGWTSTPPDISDAVQSYNDNIRRFLYYPWGIFVTAYCRYNLWTGISRIKTDYVYSDTDSIKFMNYEKHKGYIDAFNANVERKLRKACEYHGIPFEYVAPKTKEGVVKMLGVWDYEGKYDLFKTLGAKRYATYKDGKFSITVSGVNKKVAAPWLRSQKEDIREVFDLFEEGLYIPKEYTGKMTHTYIDYPQDGIIEDYNGVKGEYHELSSVHLEPADYSMSIALEYLQYLMGIREKEN